jgi:hypothetical protein
MEDLIAGGLVGLVLVLLIVAIMESRRYWDIVDTPTIPAGHAFPGVIEIFGEARLGGHSVISPLSGANCAWVQWRISGTGNDNERSTAAVITSPFQVHVTDATGVVTVYLGDRAPIEAISETFTQTELPSVSGGMLRAFANGKHPTRIATPSDGDKSLAFRSVIGKEAVTPYNSYLDLSVAGGDWAIVERRIEIGDPLYVHGSASVMPDGGPLLMAAELGPLIAFRGEERGLIKRMKVLSIGLFSAFVLAAAGTTSYVYGLLGRTSADDPVRLPLPKALLGGWFALLIVLLIQAFRVRNRIVSAREQVFSSESLIDVALAKRASLIPALNEIVVEAAHYESKAQVEFAERRTGSLSDLAVLLEAHPSLETSDAFGHLFDQACAVEDELAAARGYHVDACTVLRNRLQTFPDSWLALFAGAMPDLDALDPVDFDPADFDPGDAVDSEPAPV